MLAIGKSSQEVKGLLTVNSGQKGSRKSKGKQDSPQALKEEPENFDHFHYMFLPDHPAEQLYSQLLQKIVIYKSNLTKKIALWRDLVRFLEKLAP